MMYSVCFVGLLISSVYRKNKFNNNSPESMTNDGAWWATRDGLNGTVIFFATFGIFPQDLHRFTRSAYRAILTSIVYNILVLFHEQHTFYVYSNNKVNIDNIIFSLEYCLKNIYKNKVVVCFYLFLYSNLWSYVDWKSFSHFEYNVIIYLSTIYPNPSIL